MGKFLWEGIAKFVWKMQKKVLYYEKWVGGHASCPPRRSVKETQYSRFTPTPNSQNLQNM